MKPFTEEYFRGIIGFAALISLAVVLFFMAIDPMISLAASAFYFVTNQKG